MTAEGLTSSTVDYCSSCVSPVWAATHLAFDSDNICSGCRAAELKKSIDWNTRAEKFVELLSSYRSDSDYDCVVPVSGGKDSYFAAHVAREYGLRPLMVTYHGNNYLPEGEENLNKMKDEFGFDHLIFRPSTDVLIRLNRAGFQMTGDMNWHCHAGIFTYPMRVATMFRIPLVLWGDHGFTEQGGMYSHNDFFEYTAKDRYEHALHGFDWFDFVGKEGLTAKDLRFLVYPTDKEVWDTGLRGVFLSNYFYYDGRHNSQIAESLYNWEPARQSFDRTFSRSSNLDDMHENGLHDYLKFVKLGYGRGTDHANYEIREGRMTRDEGVEMVLKYDHVWPSDAERWFEYVGIDEGEFRRTADQFRDSRVWSTDEKLWFKTNIRGAKESHGRVYSLPAWATK